MAGGPKNGLEACLLSGTDLVGYPSIAERPSIAPTLVGRAKSVDFGGSPPRIRTRGQRTDSLLREFVKGRWLGNHLTVVPSPAEILVPLAGLGKLPAPKVDETKGCMRSEATDATFKRWIGYGKPMV